MVGVTHFLGCWCPGGHGEGCLHLIRACPHRCCGGQHPQGRGSTLGRWRAPGNTSTLQGPKTEAKGVHGGQMSLVTPGECPCPWLGQAENIPLGRSSPTLSLSFLSPWASILHWGPLHTLTAWFIRLITLKVTDLRKILNCKKGFLYVNYAVTFSIPKVYIPINIIHIYIIYIYIKTIVQTDMDRWPIFLHVCADCRRMSSCKKLASCFPFGAASFLSLISLSLSVLVSVCLSVSHCQCLIAGKEQSIQMPSKKGRPAGWRVHCVYLYRIIYKVFYTSQKGISNLGCWTGCEPLSRQAYCFLCLVQCLVRINVWIIYANKEFENHCITLPPKQVWILLLSVVQKESWDVTSASVSVSYRHSKAA